MVDEQVEEFGRMLARRTKRRTAAEHAVANAAGKAVVGARAGKRKLHTAPASQFTSSDSRGSQARVVDDAEAGTPRVGSIFSIKREKPALQVCPSIGRERATWRCYAHLRALV